MKITRVQLRKLLSEVTGGQSVNFKSMGDGTGGSVGMLSSNSTTIPTKLNQVTGEVQNAEKRVSEAKQQRLASEESVRKLSKEKLDLTHKMARYKRRAQEKSMGKASTGAEFRMAELTRKVTCSLCSDNEKNVIITRCMHAFCKSCIDANLANRNRKCPSCAHMFSKADVKEFWL